MFFSDTFFFFAAMSSTKLEFLVSSRSKYFFITLRSPVSTKLSISLNMHVGRLRNLSLGCFCKDAADVAAVAVVASDCGSY